MGGGPAIIGLPHPGRTCSRPKATLRSPYKTFHAPAGVRWVRTYLSVSTGSQWSPRKRRRRSAADSRASALTPISAPVRAATSRQPERKSLWRCVSRAWVTVRRSFLAASRYTFTSRSGSMRTASFEDREATRYAELPRSSSKTSLTRKSDCEPARFLVPQRPVGSLDSLQVHENVLHVRVEQDGVDALLLPQTGLLPPQERRLRERDRILVDGDHAGLQALRDRMSSPDVLGPEAGGESVRSVVRLDDCLVEVREPPGREDGAEHLLAGHAGLVRRIFEDRGLEEVAVF